jgi:hypothetical protein
MITEKLLNLEQLQNELAKILPERPARRTLYTWMEAKVHPMPFIVKPATGKGTGRRTGRWFVLSRVLSWLEDPAGYYAAKGPKAS